MKKNAYFVTAIGTDSGKTLVCAVLAEALGADYWKPVQAGFPRDTDTVKSLVSRTDITFHPETYLLQMPASPHLSAASEGVVIDPKKITLPEINNLVIVEGAGGLMVPLTDDFFIADLIERLNIPLILVANTYLGSINHTLLTIREIQRRNLKVEGIIFNGEDNRSTKEIILKQSGYRLLGEIFPEKIISQEVVKRYAETFRKSFL